MAFPGYMCGVVLIKPVDRYSYSSLEIKLEKNLFTELLSLRMGNTWVNQRETMLYFPKNELCVFLRYGVLGFSVL